VIATYNDSRQRTPILDVIYNPLPNSLHCEWTIAGLRAGKARAVREPLASNAAEAERMARAADETGKILGEPFTIAIIRSPSSSRAYQRRHARCRSTRGTLFPYRSGNQHPLRLEPAGGATMDLGCYPLHMIRYFSGMTPRVVSATARPGL